MASLACLWIGCQLLCQAPQVWSGLALSPKHLQAVVGRMSWRS